MKGNTVRDERVINERRKINNEAFILIMFFLMGAMLIKQFVFKAEFSDYAVEFICYFGASAYILIRNIRVGNKLVSENTKKRKFVICNSAVSGVVITMVNVYQRGSEGAGKSIYTLIGSFIFAAVGTFVVMTLLIKVNERRIKNIEKKYEDEDDF